MAGHPGVPGEQPWHVGPDEAGLDLGPSRGVGVAGGAADPFAEHALLRPRQQARPAGPRGLLHRLSGGRLGQPGEDPVEVDVARCSRPVPAGRRIAVISRKGGVGKTTASLMIGHTLAAVRQDRVLVIDGNPDAGTLGHRVRRQTSATVADALAAVDRLEGYPDARRLTSQAPSRLEVLASPEDPHSSRSLSGADYQQVMDSLHRHYTIVVCDTGTGILDNATLGILDAVDQIVVVTGTALDTARAAGMTLDWLEANGRDTLVHDAVVVINEVAPADRVDVGELSRLFSARTRAVHHVPYDRHLEEGSVTDPDRLSPAAQLAWLAVAASVADGFGLPSPRDHIREEG